MKLVELECDYDDPTPLYMLIRHKVWAAVKIRAANYPREVRTFIFRKEEALGDGSEKFLTEWRELPLHLAISNESPYDVFKVLFKSYPQAAKIQGKDGMLPIHLAVEKGFCPDAINILLAGNPACIDTKNDESLTPFEIALKKSPYSVHRDYYRRALQRGPTYTAITAPVSDLLFCAAVPCIMQDVVHGYFVTAKPDDSSLTIVASASRQLSMESDSLGKKICALTSRVEQMFEAMSSVTADVMLNKTSPAPQRREKLVTSDSFDKMSIPEHLYNSKTRPPLPHPPSLIKLIKLRQRA